MSRYGGKFSFALSPFGIRWSAIIQFHVLAAQGKFSLRPAFEVERIVPYTSPGFETLLKCENNLITFEEARDRLVDLYRSDPTFKNHVNPAGESYIEVGLSTCSSNFLIFNTGACKIPLGPSEHTEAIFTPRAFYV
jgi:hypothetical protein